MRGGPWWKRLRTKLCFVSLARLHPPAPDRPSLGLTIERLKAEGLKEDTGAYRKPLTTILAQPLARLRGAL